jgi:hypothetical protein
MYVTPTTRLFAMNLSFADEVPSASNYTAMQAQEERSKADTMLGLCLSSPNYNSTQGLSSSNYKPTQDLSNPNFEPTESDILCGRGRGRFLHEGNTLYLSLLRKNVHRYASSTKRMQKSVVVTSIVTALKNHGFRFIKQEEMSQRWYELRETAAYDRTAHAIRDLIRKKKLKNSKSSPPTASKSQCSASMKNRNSSTSVFSSISLLELPKSVFSLNTAVKARLGKPSDLLASANSAQSLAKAESAVGALSSASYANKWDPLIQPRIFETLENKNPKQRSSSFDIFYQLNSTDFDQILREVDNEKSKNKCGHQATVHRCYK